MRNNPNWFSVRRFTHQHVPADVLPWLLDRKSLTARMLKNCAGEFEVELLGQWRGKPMPGESRFLGIPIGRMALIREVRLRCGTEAWVYARSVIPFSTLHGPGRTLGHLGTRPLGAVLFSDHRVRRNAIELAKVGPGDLVYQHALRGLTPRPEELWGRRSLFSFRDAPLLVSEWFLPDLPKKGP